MVFRIIVCILLLAILDAAGQRCRAEPMSGHPRVIDGDTIAIAARNCAQPNVRGACREEHIRLKGIDAPETNQTCKRADQSEYACGREATLALRSLIGALDVTCDLDGKDVYGRWLGTCYTMMVPSLNWKMVTDGWAVVRYFNHNTMELWSAQKGAKAAKRGLWAGTFEYPWDWRKEHNHH